MGDGQDGVSIIWPGGAAKLLAVLAVTVQRKGRRFSLDLAQLSLPFSRGSSTEFANGVREPLLQGAHRASGTWGAGSRTARWLRGQWNHRGGDAAFTACCWVWIWEKKEGKLQAWISEQRSIKIISAALLESRWMIMKVLTWNHVRFIWGHKRPAERNMTMSPQSHSHCGNTNRNGRQEHFRSKIEHWFWSITAETKNMCETSCFSAVGIWLCIESHDKLIADNLCENMSGWWLSASWFSTVSGGHGKWASGVGSWNRTSTLILCGEDPCLGLFVCSISPPFLILPLPLNTAGLPRPKQILLQLWSVLSRLSYASHPHFDLYLISDLLPPLGPIWKSALCFKNSQLVNIIIVFLKTATLILKEICI